MHFSWMDGLRLSLSVFVVFPKKSLWACWFALGEGVVVVRGHPGYIPGFPIFGFASRDGKMDTATSSRDHCTQRSVRGQGSSRDSGSLVSLGSEVLGLSPRGCWPTGNTRFLAPTLLYWVVISQVGIETNPISPNMTYMHRRLTYPISPNMTYMHRRLTLFTQGSSIER